MTDVDSLDGLRALVAEAEAAGTAEARWRAVAAVDPTLVERIIHGGVAGLYQVALQLAVCRRWPLLERVLVRGLAWAWFA
ncbi:hypothetical protein CM1200mP19_1700 [bacterium]|nr:MAG: hypothetical protein CM1200mP19_1700 [bacterium]